MVILAVNLTEQVKLLKVFSGLNTSPANGFGLCFPHALVFMLLLLPDKR